MKEEVRIDVDNQGNPIIIPLQNKNLVITDASISPEGIAYKFVDDNYITHCIGLHGLCNVTNKNICANHIIDDIVAHYCIYECDTQKYFILDKYTFDNTYTKM